MWTMIRANGITMVRGWLRYGLSITGIAAEKFAELKMRIRRKEFKKRSLGRLSLKLDGDEPRDDSVPSLEIGFRLYNLIQVLTFCTVSLFDRFRKLKKGITLHLTQKQMNH